MRKGGGFGMLMLVVVLAIVLLLVARHWKAVAPTAVQVHEYPSAAPVDAHGEDEAGAALQSGTLPDLNDMRQATDAHAQQVQDALEEIE
jgi:hypothetical protein